MILSKNPMKKILLVEDEIAFTKLLTDKLTREGYEVSSADDGQKGLKAAVTTHPDLILLDIRLPVMDGLTMMGELRKDSWGAKSKVILLTNQDPDKEVMEKVLSVKPALYLIKSNIRLTELMEKIKSIIG